MKVTLNHVAALCVAGATAVMCTAIAAGATGETLAAGSGLAIVLASTAGTIAGRSKDKA